jgi:Lon protease-like protein
MTRTLPIFPLRVVVFPGEKINLHIFEERYRQLIHECKESGKTFGIPAFINNNIREIGTEMYLRKIERVYDDGKLDIKISAAGLFRIVRIEGELEDKLYTSAIVKDYDNQDDGDIFNLIKIHHLVKKLYDSLKIKRPIPESNESKFIYKIAHHIGLNIEKEYELLKLQSENQRQKYIIKHLKNLIPIVGDMEELRKKIKQNGHFKNYSPLDF